MWVLDVFRSVSKGVALLLGHRPKRVPKMHRILNSQTHSLLIKHQPKKFNLSNLPLYSKFIQADLSPSKQSRLSKLHLIKEQNEGFKAIRNFYSVSPKPQGPQVHYFKLEKEVKNTIACFTLVNAMQHRIAVSRILEDLQSIFSEILSSSDEGPWNSVVTTHSSMISDVSDLEDDLFL
jgi:hypothetical protein